MLRIVAIHRPERNRREVVLSLADGRQKKVEYQLCLDENTLRRLLREATEVKAAPDELPPGATR